MSDVAPLRWGIVGPGAIARDFAASLARHEAGRIVAVCGRSLERSAAFARTSGGTAVESVEAMLGVPGLEAVYVATPHTEHVAPAERFLREGVPVLCEKPMTTSARETEWLVGVAGMTATPLLEGWMYRTHPQWARLLELVADGALGQVERIEARYGFEAREHASPRLFDPALGGGAILDLGGYPVSAALAIAGAATGVPVGELDVAIAGGGSATEHGVDRDALATMHLEGITAALATSIGRDLEPVVVVHGDRASASLQTPFLPEGRRDGIRGLLRLRNADGDEHTETLEAEVDCLAAEALTMAEVVRGGVGARPPAPMVDHDESLVIASLLDAWRELVPGLADLPRSGIGSEG